MSSPNTTNTDIALQLAGRGFRVLPLISRGKRPSVKSGEQHGAATTDVNQILEWERKFNSGNIGIVAGNGLFVVDVDGPAGVETLRALCAGCELPRTLTVRSGRAEAGYHLYFKGEVPSSSADSLEIRSDGKICVVPPSLHKSGRRYVYARELPIAHAPEWFMEACRARVSRGAGKVKPRTAGALPAHLAGSKWPRLVDAAIEEMQEEVDAADLAEAAAQLANPDLSWDDWCGLLMAFWRAAKGSEAGRAAAHVFSRKSKKYDPAAVDERWNHFFRSPPNAIGFGSIVAKIRESVPDWVAPSRRPRAPEEENNSKTAELAENADAEEQPESLFDQAQPDKTTKVNGFHSLPNLFEDIDLDTPGDPLAKLNKKFAVIGNVGGKCLIMTTENSNVEDGLKVPLFQTFKTFNERYMHRNVVLKVRQDDGTYKEEVKPLGSYWPKWSKRRTYEYLTLAPNGPQELPGKGLNLWQGYNVHAAPGAWPLMQRHICEVLAGGHRAAADYIIRWAAWTVQNPGKCAEVALVLRGGKGTGKGTFAHALRRLFGQHGLAVSHSKHLIGSFNAHLRLCLLLFADEAFWAGDKQGESTLKALITEDVFMIEQKGVDAMQWRNRLHLIMAANADWVVPASHDERRYAVFDVSNKYQRSKAYFTALYNEIHSDAALGAMLHDLQTMNLGDWHPREIVETSALRQQKVESMGELDAWFEKLLQDGHLPFHYAGAPDQALGSAVMEHYQRGASRRGDLSSYALAKYLKRVGCTSRHTEKGTLWTFPPVVDLRDAWVKKWGEWVWADYQEAWQDRKNLAKVESVSGVRDSVSQ